MLTAVDAGEVDVTVSEADSDLSGICHIKVVVTTTGVITPASLELKTNGQLNAALGAKAAPENATSVKLGTVPLHISFIEATQTGTAQSNLFDLHRPLFSS